MDDCEGDGGFTDGSLGSPSFQDSYGAVYDPVVGGEPDTVLTLGADGYYHDSAGNEWADEVGGAGWLRVIAQVTSTPSDLEQYVTAYQGINAEGSILDWFLSLALPGGDLFAGVPEAELAARFGEHGAEYFAELLLKQKLVPLASEVGDANLADVSASELNTEMGSKGFTNPPFSANTNGVRITTTSANSNGILGGSQLVRINSQTGSLFGAWTANLSDITNADGTLMSAQEIQDKFALPSLPTDYSLVTEIPIGTEVDAGIAGPNYGGSGGGFQYFVNSNKLNFGDPVTIPQSVTVQSSPTPAATPVKTPVPKPTGLCGKMACN